MFHQVIKGVMTTVGRIQGTHTGLKSTFTTSTAVTVAIVPASIFERCRWIRIFPARERTTPGHEAVKLAVSQGQSPRERTKYHHGYPLRISLRTQDGTISPHAQAGKAHDHDSCPIHRLGMSSTIASKPPSGEDQIEAEHRNQQKENVSAKHRQGHCSQKYHCHADGINPTHSDMVGAAFGRSQGKSRRQQSD